MNGAALPPPQWPRCPEALDVDRDTVHVVSFELDVPDDEFERLADALSDAERSRARRLVRPLDRRRYLTGRAILRDILARCLSAPARCLIFEYGRAGKPALADPHATLQFNLSHSEGQGLAVVARDRPVGVDLEARRDGFDWDGVAARFFTPGERQSIRGIGSDRRRRAACFTCWSRKEAYLKARGDGLSWQPDSFSVSVDPDAPAELLFPAGERGSWWLHDLDVPGFAACLACEGAEGRVERWRWRALTSPLNGRLANGLGTRRCVNDRS